MSEFSYAILVKSKNEKEIISLIQAEKVDGYLYDLNSQWTALTLENHLDRGKEYAEKIFKKLNVPVINFFNSEDYSWAFRAYCNKSQAYLQIQYDYEKPLTLDIIQSSRIDLLHEIGGKQEDLRKLEKHLYEYPRNMFEGVELFKKAFGFELISWFSYDYFSQEKSLKGVKHIKKDRSSKKRVQVGKIIKNVLEKRLRELDYNFEKNPEFSTCDYGFYKDQNGFKVGLEVYLSDYANEYRLGARVTSECGSEDLFELAEGEYRNFSFNKTEEDLSINLEKVLEIFLKYGVDFIEIHRLKPFNIKEVYRNQVDPFLEAYSFKRVYTDDNVLNGGRVFYQGTDIKIEFLHNPVIASVLCYIITDKGERVFLDELLSTSDTGINLRLFRNEKEYIRNLDWLLKKIGDKLLNN